MIGISILVFLLAAVIGVYLSLFFYLVVYAIREKDYFWLFPGIWVSLLLVGVVLMALGI